jgi:thiol-disulfide isomerase/thioredoxin
MSTVDLTRDGFLEATHTKRIVIVYFRADWSAPCRTFDPIFESAASQHSDVVFGKVDTDAQQVLADSLGIRGVPALMTYREGHLVRRDVGAMNAADLDLLIKQAMAMDVGQSMADGTRLNGNGVSPGRKTRREELDRTFKELLEQIRDLGKGDQAARPLRPSTADVDTRLVGTWFKTKDYFMGGLSFTSQVCRTLGPDGRFVQSTQGHESATYRNGSGDWTGWEAASTRPSPEERGSWSTRGNRLLLQWDDNTRSVYEYDYARNGLLLVAPDGRSEMWTPS